MKRVFDFIFSLTGILFFLPFGIIIAAFIIIESKGGVFYLQTRVGKNNQDFRLIKFRTMRTGSEKKGLLTVGKDNRITGTGRFLRKFKLDEMPQLLNILIGTMSIVGPRPEVRKYVDMYNENQKKVLLAKPGLTDYASLEYFNENELLGKSENPEKTYIEEVMPAKLLLNEKYLSDISLGHDLKIIFKTLGKVFRQ
ncbi:MAG: glycosyl transferase [Bacteroidetes bacterium HGW-Bacteroidetes-21]|nr:MAG: glycosyl transferase [Bacteroidetes bacterium HGW-Bacteroidetes-21]